jgi:hypothetical protein
VVYCAQAALAFSTAARRDAVLTDIQTRILGRPRWAASAEEVTAADLSERIPGGTNGITVTGLRFTNRADADDLLNRIRAFAVGQRLPLAGSWVEVHDCPHDEGRGACTVNPADATRW